MTPIAPLSQRRNLDTPMIDAQQIEQHTAPANPVPIGPVVAVILAVLAGIQALMFTIAVGAGWYPVNRIRWQAGVASMIGLGFVALSVMAGIGWLKGNAGLRLLSVPMLIAAAGLNGLRWNRVLHYGVWVSTVQLIALVVWFAVTPAAFAALRADTARLRSRAVQAALAVLTVTLIVSTTAVGYGGRFLRYRGLVRYQIIWFARPALLLVLIGLAVLGVVAQRGSGAIMLTVGVGATLAMDAVIMLTENVLLGNWRVARGWPVPVILGAAVLGLGLAMWRSETARAVTVTVAHGPLPAASWPQSVGGVMALTAPSGVNPNHCRHTLARRADEIGHAAARQVATGHADATP